MEPSSHTEPMASVPSCAHSNGLPVCGFVKANSENAQEDSTSTAVAAPMLKPAGILKNGIQESNVRILKNEIQDGGSNEDGDWILKCSKKKEKGSQNQIREPRNPRTRLGTVPGWGKGMPKTR